MELDLVHVWVNHALIKTRLFYQLFVEVSKTFTQDPPAMTRNKAVPLTSVRRSLSGYQRPSLQITRAVWGSAN